MLRITSSQSLGLYFLAAAEARGSNCGVAAQADAIGEQQLKLADAIRTIPIQPFPASRLPHYICLVHSFSLEYGNKTICLKIAGPHTP